jgi:hypothetical protein
MGIVGIVVLACAPEYTTTGDTRQSQTSGCPADFCKGAKSRCILEGDVKTCACPLGSHEEAGGCADDAKCAVDGSSCSKHGSCAETKDGKLACMCDASNGYTGSTCNECLTTLGFHKSADGATCTRDACDIAPSPCDANPDPNRKRCSVVADKTECGCNEGYVLNAGGVCVVPQSCDGRATCNGRGECSVTAAKVSCACDPGYAGALCSTCASGYFPKGDGTCFANPCTANPCAAAANTACIVDASKATNYRCDCRFGDGFTMNGAACVCAADAFECTSDIIQGGRCVHPARTSAACNDGDSNVCTNGVCNASGQCVATASPNGTSCGGDACSPQLCQAATCTIYPIQCGGGGDGGDGA